MDKIFSGLNFCNFSSFCPWMDMKRSDLHPIFLITGNKTHYPKLTEMKDKVLQQGKKPASTTSTAFPSKYEIMFFSKQKNAR